MYKYRKFAPGNLAKQMAGVGLHQIQPKLRKRWCDYVDSIVVETEEMKSVLVETGYVEANKPVYPIPYGVDPEIFAVRDRTLCRSELGISPDEFVLAYVGSLNRFIQEPGPIIEALGREQPKNVVLYMVGDGAKQGELEELVRQFNAPVRFVGRLPQKDAALYIGASNLCIAPYNKDLYFGEKFTCASLKVPEYMSCGRAVLTIPCERMEMLTDQQRYGLLVPNRVEDYQKFFRNLPSLTQLAEMETQIIHDMARGILRDKKILLRWWDIADMYKEVIEDAIATKHNEMALAG
jgi:glycosyltransferase involved in cell wall biosynthesis